MYRDAPAPWDGAVTSSCISSPCDLNLSGILAEGNRCRFLLLINFEGPDRFSGGSEDSIVVSILSTALLQFQSYAVTRLQIKQYEEVSARAA